MKRLAPNAVAPAALLNEGTIQPPAQGTSHEHCTSSGLIAWLEERQDYSTAAVAAAKQAIARMLRCLRQGLTRSDAALWESDLEHVKNEEKATLIRYVGMSWPATSRRPIR